jgi:integrase
VERLDWLAGTMTIMDPKSGETERVPINSAVRSVLSARKEALGDPVPDDRVFPHDGSRLRRTFSTAVRKAGLAPFRFHDLRHTFASRLAMSGANDRCQ